MMGNKGKGNIRPYEIVSLLVTGGERGEEGMLRSAHRHRSHCSNFLKHLLRQQAMLQQQQPLQQQ